MSPGWKLGEHLLNQVSTGLTFARFKQPFEIYLMDSFEEDYKVLQKYLYTRLYGKPFQILLMYIKRPVLLQGVDYNQMSKKFHELLQLLD